MNTVTCHASPDRHRLAPVLAERGGPSAPGPPPAGVAPAAPDLGWDRRRASGTQTSAATAAGAAQQASEPRQPRPARSATGTATATATVAITPMAPLYSPVIHPVRSGKSRFTRPGSSTLPAALANPSRVVPPNSAATGPLERSRMPATSTTMLASSVRSMPKRRPSRGANDDSAPNASSGRVVIRPASPWEMPVSPRISPTSGPTEVIAARRLPASNRIAAASSPARARDWNDGGRTLEMVAAQPAVPRRQADGGQGGGVGQQRQERVLEAGAEQGGGDEGGIGGGAEAPGRALGLQVGDQRRMALDRSAATLGHPLPQPGAHLVVGERRGGHRQQLAVEADRGAGQALQVAFDGALADAGGELAHGAADAAGDRAEGGAEQGGLVLEVVVDAALGDLGGAGDLLGGGAGDAALADHLDGGGDDPLAHRPVTGSGRHLASGARAA